MIFQRMLSFFFFAVAGIIWRHISQCFDQQQSERTKKKSEKKLGNMSEYFQCLS